MAELREVFSFLLDLKVSALLWRCSLTGQQWDLSRNGGASGPFLLGPPPTYSSWEPAGSTSLLPGVGARRGRWWATATVPGATRAVGRGTKDLASEKGTGWPERGGLMLASGQGHLAGLRLLLGSDRLNLGQELPAGS